MRINSLVGAIIIVLCSWSICFACDCVTPSAEENFQEADSVFVGEVIKVADASGESVFTFRVQKLLKGPGRDEAIIFSKNSDCDYPFNLSTVYLVYAKTFKNRLTSGTCSGTGAVAASTAMLPSSASASVSSRSSICRYLAIIGLGVLLSLLIWFLPVSTWRRA